MSKYMSIGSFDNAMAGDGPDALTDEEVTVGLSDQGSRGTRVAKIQFGGPDGTDIISASNHGLTTAKEQGSHDNQAQIRLNYLNQQNEQLIQAAKQYEPGSPKHDLILANMAKLEEQAQKVVDDGVRSDVAHAVEIDEAKDRQLNGLQAELSEQEAANELMQKLEREKRVKRLMH